jgi:hypothetical protein
MPNIKLGKSYMFDFDEVIEWFKARG